MYVCMYVCVYVCMYVYLQFVCVVVVVVGGRSLLSLHTQLHIVIFTSIHTIGTPPKVIVDYVQNFLYHAMPASLGNVIMH